ncbi:hypothetical protein EIP91_010976 [Steccherinum ochraceum]|uniref:Uncharacterized protein n=1 Tax=Steccherinum ochraceum TaxID=92696 RepID=A0A4R0RWH4_9APHY|nr:hypothetical protein EIP91_010976 [Steccherinum ochraceum]
MSHRLADVEPRGRKQTFSVKSIDSPEHPFARIKFFYRPYAMLRAQGVIPASTRTLASSTSRALPSTVKAEVKQELASTRSSDDLALATRAAKEDRLKALKAEMDRLQAELDVEPFGLDGPKMKREASPIRVPQSGSGERVVVDLTLD